MTDEHLDRLMAMIAPGQQTWDLSPNDVEAIRWVLADRDRLRRERNAFMIGVICNALDSDDDLVEEMLGDPRKLSECGDQFVRLTESSAFAKYLDLPSDLGATS